VLPAIAIGEEQLAAIKDYTIRLARALNVIGLMNVQYAIQNGKVYVLEVNPRASRTVPYVSKATGVQLAKIAVRLMTGAKLRDLGYSTGTLEVRQFFVKSPVFPFHKFPGVDPILGPEMRSTGEVMGVGEIFGEAFAKAQLSAGQALPEQGSVFLSVNDRQKQDAVEVARKFADLGFSLVATRGTAFTLKAAGIDCRTVLKVNEGRPNVVDLIKAGELSLIINTPAGAHSFFDEKSIRRAAVTHRIPCITTLSGAKAAANGIAARRENPVRVWSLQQLHGTVASRQ
ncbi:MAG: ATP-grasp domain-containing protein, partial [Acidobacteria bacterium]|nr:ATP-grasp domain-containing protein [Acidobacteriota bacterium]